ncbi:phosphotransferase [Streptomyces triticiradicis]|uniref:phosphotransferase n=1 Tax=Streptomyces triticiradicis TaxID=2651189 RepID=UPI001788BB45|nr:phosphotransferase [Streptomyces triticiradicis]
MLLPPDDVDLDQLGREIDLHYDADPQPFEFVPLGEDSWSFRRGALWVSLRRDLRGHVPGAYHAAHLLERSGTARVLAPLMGADGRIVRTVGRYPVVVFPYRELEQLTPHGITADDATAVVTLLDQVHRAGKAALAATELPCESYEIAFRDDLTAALDFADAPPAVGNGYRARLHRLLRTHRDAIRAMLRELADLAAVCAAQGEPFVLTHGEPSAANILRGADGLVLADWGGALWGPPERDWFHVRRTLGIDVPDCRRPFLDFYRVRWVLSEIAEYATRFGAPRADGAEDAEDVAMWGRLLRYLPED